MSCSKEATKEHFQKLFGVKNAKVPKQAMVSQFFSPKPTPTPEEEEENLQAELKRIQHQKALELQKQCQLATNAEEWDVAWPLRPQAKPVGRPSNQYMYTAARISRLLY
eukprot:NODE_3397_length_560_cov_93.808219_g2865_i0.p1 GENE.NODE_3397_length_560_cov_93.808219_g2865_i0~~NODE_3397_length_560_cov_93.808219_g2865_i0.p1  ORF type:complete len:109 (-),score=26.21 NODE_3397_length_560_cov_93.808219_g2865_i0:164-490(-)